MQTLAALVIGDNFVILEDVHKMVVHVTPTHLFEVTDAAKDVYGIMFGGMFTGSSGTWTTGPG